MNECLLTIVESVQFLYTFISDYESNFKLSIMFSHNSIKTTNDMKKQFSVSRDEVVRVNRQLVNNYGGPVKLSPEEKAVLKLIGHKDLSDIQKRDVIRRSLNEAWSRR